jgi:hypothetical protein
MLLQGHKTSHIFRSSLNLYGGSVCSHRHLFFFSFLAAHTWFYFNMFCFVYIANERCFCSLCMLSNWRPNVCVCRTLLLKTATTTMPRKKLISRSKMYSLIIEIIWLKDHHHDILQTCLFLVLYTINCLLKFSHYLYSFDLYVKCHKTRTAILKMVL